MPDAHEMDKAEMIERAKARIDAMNQAAEELRQELGLPPEAKYDVLSVMYSQADDKLVAASKAYAKNKRRDNGEDMSERGSLLESTQIGRYHIINELGRGMWGRVYLCQDQALGNLVAIKVLTSFVTDDELKKFRVEARILANLDHPNIVRVRDFGVERGTPYLVMHYASEGTLRKHCPADIKLPPRIVASYIKQIASALKYIHNQHRSIIHRDVKPENILLDRDNKFLLSDFGIATIVQNTSDQSLEDMAETLTAISPEQLGSRPRLETVAGTFPYMAPEQFEGKPCAASDQYALGIIVYELLSGGRPFKGSLSEIVAQHAMALPPPLHDSILTVLPSVKEEVERVVLRALAKDSKQRYESVEAFANALEKASEVVVPQPYEKEWQAIEDAIRLKPRDPQNYVELARIFLRGENYGEALACYENTIGLDSQNAQFHRGRAAMLRRLRRDKEALAAYEEAIKLDAANPYLYKEKGDTHRKLNQFEEALAYYNEATRLDPSFALAYQSKGEIHEQLSKQAYEKAKALKGSQGTQQMKR